MSDINIKNDPRLANLPFEPEQEWKTCSRVRGERSLQFYGLRRGWTWKLSEKTRDVVTQMRKRFGAELDVITLMGHVDPQPFARSWRRFDSEFEVVDLGRNKKQAEETLKILEAQARAEYELRNLASGTTEQHVHRALVEIVFRRRKLREDIARKISNHGLSTVCSRWGDDRLLHLAKVDRNAEIAAAILKDVRKALPEDQQPVSPSPPPNAVDRDVEIHVLDAEAVLPRVRQTIETLREQAVKYSGSDVSHADDPFQSAYALSEPRARAEMLESLAGWESKLVGGLTAREIMKARAEIVKAQQAAAS